MNEFNLQTMICKNNIFFYEEYIDIFIDYPKNKLIIDKNYIYDTTHKLYNFFSNIIHEKKIRINNLYKNKIRIRYKNTNQKNILKKDIRKNGQNNDFIEYSIYHLHSTDSIELIEFILDNNYDINMFGGDNNNLLLELLSTCFNIETHLKIIKKIIDKTDNINLINNENKNCLIYCIIYNYYNLFKYIIDTKDTTFLLEHNSCNIFYNLMLFKRYDLFLICLSKVNINIENFLGENLLMMAIKFKNITFIDLVINNIDINHINIFGENALLYCFINKYYQILNHIVDKRHNDIDYNIISSLIEYNYENKYNDILFLLEKGADVNKVSEITGNIPLQDAIIHNDNYIIELLIQYNSNINYQNNDGYTPLMLSIVMNNLNIVKLLLSKNCNIYLYNNKKLNSLMISYIFNNNDIFELLIDKYQIFDNDLICLEKKVRNKNISLLLLWFDKMIKIISSDLIKYYFFRYKIYIYDKLLKEKTNYDIITYITSFLQNRNLYLKYKISSNIKHIKYEINLLF